MFCAILVPWEISDCSPHKHINSINIDLNPVVSCQMYMYPCTVYLPTNRMHINYRTTRSNVIIIILLKTWPEAESSGIRDHSGDKSKKYVLRYFSTVFFFCQMKTVECWYGTSPAGNRKTPARAQIFICDSDRTYFCPDKRRSLWLFSSARKHTTQKTVVISRFSSTAMFISKSQLPF